MEEPVLTNHKGNDDNKKTKSIFVLDESWSLNLTPSLSILCLENIVSNFEVNPVLESLTPSDRDFLLERLSTSLPLHVTTELISDGIYWKRCCEHQWEINDVVDYGHSWKRMFFEKRLESMIELFVPGVTDPQTILDMIPHCRDYVRKLTISQLLVSKVASLVDHFDFSILLDKLIHLEELHVINRVKQTSMNFEWKMIEMSDQDCESLAKALRSCKTVKRLKLQLSNMKDKHCQLLVRYLLDHPSLTELDFSHNVICDGGAKSMGDLLNRGRLQVLNMCNNNIRDKGAKAIACALSRNTALLSLNLRLNRMTDEGAQAIAKALLKNRALQHLQLGANELTALTAIELSNVLAQNQTLKSVSVSCDKLDGLNDEILKTPCLQIYECPKSSAGNESKA